MTRAISLLLGLFLAGAPAGADEGSFPPDVKRVMGGNAVAVLHLDFRSLDVDRFLGDAARAAGKDVEAFRKTLPPVVSDLVKAPGAWIDAGANELWLVATLDPGLIYIVPKDGAKVEALKGLMGAETLSPVGQSLVAATGVYIVDPGKIIAVPQPDLEAAFAASGPAPIRIAAALPVDPDTRRAALELLVHPFLKGDLFGLRDLTKPWSPSLPPAISSGELDRVFSKAQWIVIGLGLPDRQAPRMTIQGVEADAARQILSTALSEWAQAEPVKKASGCAGLLQGLRVEAGEGRLTIQPRDPGSWQPGFLQAFAHYPWDQIARPANSGLAWFYDTETGEYFTDNTTKIAPFNRENGHEAVRAHFFTCTDCAEGNRFVGYYEKYTPEVKKKLEENPNAYNIYEMAFQGRLYSEDGMTWVPADKPEGIAITSKLVTRCPPKKLRYCPPTGSDDTIEHDGRGKSGCP